MQIADALIRINHIKRRLFGEYFGKIRVDRGPFVRIERGKSCLEVADAKIWVKAQILEGRSVFFK